jgi:hypothetical protein
MRGNLKVGASAVAVLVIAIGAAHSAQGPGKINYQSVLRDATGKARAGSFDMVFRFYDAPTGGNEILLDRHEAAGTGAVTVTTGLFSAALGGGTVEDGSGPGTYLSLRDVFTRNDEVYLEVTVGGETLSPRAQVLSSAFTMGNLGPDGPCFDGANRFVDCNNGTLTDTVTGLIWLKDANCSLLSPKNFADANNAASGLQSGQCGLTDGSAKGAWRLPSPAEWQGIFKASCYPNPGAPTILDKAGTGCHATGAQWASGVQSNFYWSSTTDSDFPLSAWGVNLGNGSVDENIKNQPYGVWPVRGGP